MSWTIDKTILDEKLLKRFNEALTKAAKHAIMFSALSDQGQNYSRGDSYPANFVSNRMLKISSYDLVEGARRDSEPDKDAFYFPAERLPIKRLPEYMGEAKIELEGSSYATTLAAGVASFLLSCGQFACYEDRNGSDQQDQQPDKVKEKLKKFKDQLKTQFFAEKMCSHDEPWPLEKKVKPWLPFERRDWDKNSISKQDKMTALREILMLGD
jgi:hypothetical protein